MPSLVHEFRAGGGGSDVLVGDAASAALYKQALSRHLVASLKEGLHSQLGREVSQALQVTQLALTEKIAGVASSSVSSDGMEDLVKITPRNLPPLTLTFSQVLIP